MQPLICSPSPRDISEFKEAISQLPADRLLAKWYPEAEAYSRLLEYFLDHKEYTHMCIIPDDLIVTPVDFEELANNIDHFGYPYLAGVCNLKWDHVMYAVKVKGIGDGYPYMDSQDLADRCKSRGSHIFQVAWEGFACPFIRRDVFKHVVFRSKTGMSFDDAFARDCRYASIPIRVNSMVRLLHLKGKPEITQGVTRTLNYRHPDAHLELELFTHTKRKSEILK